MRALALVLLLLLVPSTLAALFPSDHEFEWVDSSSSASESSTSRYPLYEELFEGGASAKQSELCTWLFEHGFKDSGFITQRDYGESGGGMAYRRAVKRGAELFAVPTELMVYTSNPHLAPLTKRVLQVFRENFRAPGAVAPDLELTEMGLILLFERREPKSFWRHYLDTLQTPLCPALFPEALLSKFENPMISQYARYFVQDSLDNFEKLMKLPEFELARTPGIEDDFVWAVASVLQRSFDWGPDGRREYVMVPYMDMINHKFDISNNYYYSAGPLHKVHPDGHVEKVKVPQSMVLAADADYEEGDEAYISYSMASNSVQLLLQYGFVTEDNANDYIALAIKHDTDDPAIQRTLARSPPVCVDRRFSLPYTFVAAISVLLGHEPKVTAQAVQLIRDSVQANIDQFSTTLADDQAQLSTKLSRAQWMVLAYRVEAKKFLHKLVSTLDADLEAIRGGDVPAYDYECEHHDWPVRMVMVEVPSDEKKASHEDL